MSSEEPPKKKKNFYKLKTPDEVPIDVAGGEIVGILPFTFGSTEEVLEEKRKKGQSETQNTDETRAGPSTGTKNDTKCPKCDHPSVRILKNIVPGKDICVGIPTCMNIKCMWISSDLVRLPMPWLTSYEVDMSKVNSENRNYENPLEDDYLRSILKFGEYLKTHSPKPPLPIDKASINYYRNVPKSQFEEDIKEIFGGKIPKIPGIEDDEVDPHVPVVDEDDDDIQVVYEDVQVVQNDVQVINEIQVLDEEKAQQGS